MTRMVTLTCRQCGKQFEVKFKDRRRVFCNRSCQHESVRGAGNPSFGKTYRTKATHPEWAQRVADTHRQRGHITGDKNPMKRPEVAERVSNSRKARFKTDPDFRASVSNLMKKAWQDGKFDGIPVGKCKWFSYTKKDGTVCKLQGTWELAYAKWLDEQGIEFVAHRGRIPYRDSTGQTKSYFPDFFLTQTNEYVDVKNQYHFALNSEKWDHIRATNPDINLVLLFEEDLVKMGVMTK